MKIFRKKLLNFLKKRYARIKTLTITKGETRREKSPRAVSHHPRPNATHTPGSPANTETPKRKELKKGMTQQEAAKLLGMKSLYSYQRLESSKKSNPTLSMLHRVKRLFPELKIDDLLVD